MVHDKEYGKRGFTMVELMLGLFLSMIVIYGIYGVVSSQTRAFGISEQVVEAQQNARALLSLMSREIRMAGYDPGWLTRTEPLTLNGEETLPGFLTAQATQTRFVQNLGCCCCNDGGPGYGLDFVDTDLDDEFEDIAYSYSAEGRELRRNNMVLATNVDAIEFSYRFEDGDEGIPGVQADGTDDVDDIRAVRITLMTRTEQKHRGVEGDGYHRRTLSTLVKVRNLGML
ncbi:prepilin-type N-terminal cleavage/methylation domain-containing protein [Thermodesulfobacteriota bacterium]